MCSAVDELCPSQHYLKQGVERRAEPSPLHHQVWLPGYYFEPIPVERLEDFEELLGVICGPMHLNAKLLDILK